MSTISNVDEAIDALCRGEFFQVGGEIINPQDIVRVDYNGGQNPIFYLEDGSTVQHDRFQNGDVGDFLANALQVATRGSTQSEAIKPNANRLLRIHNGSALLTDLNGNGVLTYSGSGVTRDHNAELSIEKDAAAVYDGTCKLFDYKGTLLSSGNFGGGFSGDEVVISIQEDGSALFMGHEAAGMSLEVLHLNRDGTSTTVHSVTTSNNHVPIGGTISTGQNGYVVAQDTSGYDMRRWPLDDATGAGSSLTNSSPEAAIMRQAFLDDNSGLLYYINNNRDLVSLDVSNLAATEKKILDAPDNFVSTQTAAVADYVPGTKDRFGIVDGNGNEVDEFVLINEDGKELVSKKTISGVNAAQLDVSAV